MESASQSDIKSVERTTSSVLPLLGESEIAGYTGGYTVKRHGLLGAASNAVAGKVNAPSCIRGDADIGGTCGGVADAVQLEFGRDYRRTPEARKTTADAIALALFYHLHPSAYAFEEGNNHS